MAFAAVTSLKQTIQRLLSSSNITIDSSSRETLDIAYNHLTSLQQVLTKSDERLSSSRLKALEGEIREASHKLEDSLESHALSQFLSSHAEEDAVSSPLKVDLKEIWHEFNSFAEAAKKMEEDYTQLLHDYDDDDDDDDVDTAQSKPIDFGVKMIGLSDVIADYRDHLMRVIRPDDFGFFSFYGSPGTGRSILAKTVYDMYIGKEGYFDCGAWVRIGSTYQLKQILLSIISQINHGVDDDHEFLSSQGEEKLGEYVLKSLQGRRYMVGLDDLRDTDILIKLRRSLPEQSNGSLVLLTTGLTEVAAFDDNFTVLEMPTMDEDFSWPYIREFFFHGDAAPPEFEEIGRNIGRKCGGIQLVVARVIVILRRINEAEEWSRLAAAQYDRVYVVDDELSEARDVQKYLGEHDEEWANVLLFDVSKLLVKVKDILYPDRLFAKMGIMTTYGMAGVGKTTLIKKLFGDPLILSCFDHCAWVNVGSKYKSEEILIDTLAQIYPHIDRQSINDDATLAADLCSQLSDKKCLIVLDDLWSQGPARILKKFLPNIKGELIITTRLLKVGGFGPCDRFRKLRLLNKDESWDLLREKVFGEEFCPPKLESAGKKIAENCEGLPLLILSVADKLSKSEKTFEYWNMVASRKEPTITEAQIEVSKSLIPSYEALPQHLKACFLYMGGFPQNFEISTSMLMKLWFVEGFLEPNSSQSFEDFASKCLHELVDSTMVIFKKGSDLKSNKTCDLHSVFWHLSYSEAIKSRFFHILNIYVNYLVEGSMES